MAYVLIDESGRLPDPRDRIVVIAAVYVERLVGIEKIFLKVRRKIPVKGKRRKERQSELKFSLIGEHTRRQLRNEIEKLDIHAYVLVVDKQGRKIRDTPENYGLLISETLRGPRRAFSDVEHVLIDRHFTSIHQQQSVNVVIEKRLRKTLFIQHIDSSQSPVISVADFIAGSVREHQARKIRVRVFEFGISKKIVNMRRVSWRALKSGNL